VLTNLLEPQFLTGLAQVVAIDVLLGGDNAVVIALACRRLPAHQRRKAMLGGVAAAVLLRIALLLVANQVLAWPFLKVVGAGLLLWIGVKLLLPEDEGRPQIREGTGLWQAIWIILVADFVMSLDNVIAVAGAAQGDIALLVLGVVISIPVVVWGSTLVLHLMERYRAVVFIGAALLGWIAGKLMASDPWVQSRLPDAFTTWGPTLFGAVGLITVLGLGVILGKRGADPASDH
jgi:YjbE family integral membrane protein